MMMIGRSEKKMNVFVFVLMNMEGTNADIYKDVQILMLRIYFYDC